MVQFAWLECINNNVIIMVLCRFSGTFRQIAACVVGSLPVFMAGIVLGWPSPVIEYMTAGLGPVTLSPTQTSWMIAFIDVGNFFMAIPAGWLMDWMGRKFVLTISGPLMVVGWLFILFGSRPWQLYVARLLQGAAVAIGFVVAPAYVGELASVRIRGKLGLLIQVCYGTGLQFSYTAGWLFNDYTALAIASACVSVVSSVLFLFLPESPYYLMLTGQLDDATKCLWNLRSYTAQELESEIVTVKGSVMNDTRDKTNLGNLLTRDRRPLVIVLVMAVLQMASGASVLEAYGSALLAGYGVSSNVLAVFLGLTILVAAVPFMLAVDRYGRRPLMLVSCFGTAVCHALVVYFLWHRLAGGAADNWWLPLFASISGVQFFINIGIMPMLAVVECEYFPSDTRALADTAVVLTLTLSSTVAITTYQATGGFSQVVNYAVYAALSLAGGVFCYVFMPETKCKTFVEIQKDFRPLDCLTQEYDHI
ncbi:Sugar transporter, conserved site,Major facilitator superfamily domain,Major facilitator, sugar [Cinara cedri]|uniref:Sugar transporter, conserved site,Major facilitator superfamily domain,Major facilitator, sugar n=1 Tax=Cinara cedri TaxID=506608 RepID=A0A5E4NE96_9HEMI|nr:Sugar transporter, conserved site,Major facilitator superfamily domain,Major facilitator, sugar [Cinara cedri]